MNFKFPECSPLTMSLQDLVLNSPAQWRRQSGQSDDSESKDSGIESPFPQQSGGQGDRSSRRCLFGADSQITPPSKGKRSRLDDGEGSASKRHRNARHGPMFLSPQPEKENRHCNPLSERVKRAVDKLEIRGDLIGDGSQDHVLPTVQDGKHQDLKCITPSTMCGLLNGDYRDVISSFRVIDCRYPYEFEGGHIKGAENMYIECDVEKLVKEHRHNATGRHILVFHCEFSSNRAPKMVRHLRGLDRKLNADCYPFLFYPEVYLLSGGYKAFYNTSIARTHCEPDGYKPMHHEAHAADLRHFRVKSKSWSAGESRGRVRRSLMSSSPSFM
ncbi:M-phase inducer phosphatase-like [Haliotis asinina]|uniref:M-phase inducer phosphatase-like n=1 Tax=Haliotis asinina TaxID=109174 RepID=UPI003531E83B